MSRFGRVGGYDSHVLNWGCRGLWLPNFEKILGNYLTQPDCGFFFEFVEVVQDLEESQDLDFYLLSGSLELSQEIWVELATLIQQHVLIARRPWMCPKNRSLHRFGQSRDGSRWKVLWICC